MNEELIMWVKKPDGAITALALACFCKPHLSSHVSNSLPSSEAILTKKKEKFSLE